MPASTTDKRRQIRPSDDPRTLITIPEAQLVMPLGESTYRLKLSQGKLRKFKVGSRTFLRLGDVLRMAKEA
jgi:hypothetical protein